MKNLLDFVLGGVPIPWMIPGGIATKGKDCDLHNLDSHLLLRPGDNMLSLWSSKTTKLEDNSWPKLFHM